MINVILLWYDSIGVRFMVLSMMFLFFLRFFVAFLFYLVFYYGSSYCSILYCLFCLRIMYYI